MKEQVLSKVKKEYTIVQRDMGDLAEIKRGLYRFSSEAYTVGGVGNLFFISMSAMFGLMKMETAVLTPVFRDLSFCNMDTVHALGNDTGIFEMYRTCLQETELTPFEAIREKYRQLPDYHTSPRWYDALSLSSSMGKKGKGIEGQLEMMLGDCLDLYLTLLKQAPICSADEKRAANRSYVDRLLSEGGAAVDSMKKIIGLEKTETLIRRFMYDV